MPVFALYNFNDAGQVVDDANGAGVQGGAQNGVYYGEPTVSGGQLQLNGATQYAKIFPDDVFQMPSGTLAIRFTPSGTALTGPQTVLSRDSLGDHQGSYRIEVTPDGAVVVTHETGTAPPVSFTTGPGFYAPGNVIDLSYSWSPSGQASGHLSINNLTNGSAYSQDVPGSVTMDMGDQSQPWVLGAGQNSSAPLTFNDLNGFFQGSVDTFSLSNTVDNGPVSGPDGIVDGTVGDDLIDLTFIDHNGDRVDAQDALIPGDAPNDDRIFAGQGNDTIFAGQGRDTVYAGSGNDLAYGGSGDDTLYGDAGDDTLFGGAGNDVLYGGAGSDLLFGDAGNDTFHIDSPDDDAFGGADRDTFIVGGDGAGFGSFIDGGEEGDDFDTLDLSGAGPLRIDYDAENAENGRVHFLDADGKEVGHLDFRNIENVVPCFTPGTMIATPRGEVPVESLRAGDRVITRDNGIQEIRWIGAKTLSGAQLAKAAALQPVLVKAHSLGHGLPERDMLVSPNHRLLLAEERNQLYFDEHEVLVAAKHLAGRPGIHAVQAIGVTYIYFMCDHHEVVLSNGAWTETFQPGDYTLQGMDAAQRHEIFTLFPELQTPVGLETYQAARRVLKRHEARLLAR